MAAPPPWLPAAAIARGVEEAPVCEVVRDWSARWFAGEQAAARADATFAGSPGIAANGLALTTNAGTSGILRRLMFGDPPTGDAPTAAEEAVLDGVAETCLADLHTRLIAAFRLPADRSPTVAAADDAARRCAWRIETDHAAVLHVTVGEGLIVRSLKASLPPAPALPSLGRLADALAGQAVAVSAVVGHCRLTTSELRGLSPGDLVVLDRSLGARASIAVDLHVTAASCIVEEGDDCLNLILVD